MPQCRVGLVAVRWQRLRIVMRPRSEMVSGNQSSDTQFSCTPSVAAGSTCREPASKLGLHMGNIDRQGIGAVKTLPGLGRAWQKHAGRMEDGAEFTSEADALLMRRAQDLADSSEGSAEAAELLAIVDAIEAYAGKRRPLGKVPGGKG